MKLPYSYPTLLSQASLFGLAQEVVKMFQRVAKAFNEPDHGTTAARPALDLTPGQFYFDDTLNAPIWWDAEAAAWVVATTGGGVSPLPANPTAQVGPAAVNGVASSYMRSDAAPKLADTVVTPGSYTYAAITVDQQGRLIAASSGTTPQTPGGADKTIQYNNAGTFGGIGPLTNGQIVIGSTGATAVAGSLTQPAAGLTITGGGGTVTFALANDLAALEAMSNTGLVARTASETYAQRTITGTANRLTVTNGDGVAGNPTLDISTSYVGQATITTLGIITTGTWSAGSVHLIGDATFGEVDAYVGATPTGFFGTDVGETYIGSFTNIPITVFINNTETARFPSLGGGIRLNGSTSGSVTIKTPAVAGSNTLTLPAGTTDLSATGGASQVLKQTSAGGALTVGQLSAADLSNGTTGTAGTAVVLATSPTLVTPTLGDADASSIEIISGTNCLRAAVAGANFLFGGTSPTVNFAATNGVLQTRASNNTLAPVLAFGKSRGSIGTPGAVVANDRLLEIAAWGDDGGTIGDITVQSAIIRAVVVGAVSAGVVPASWVISTRNAAGTLATRVTVSTEGGLSVGTGTDPGSGNILASNTIKAGGFTVATLPTVGTAGRRTYVTDANATFTAGIGAAVAGGGANVVPVFDDGTNWRIG